MIVAMSFVDRWIIITAEMKSNAEKYMDSIRRGSRSNEDYALHSFPLFFFKKNIFKFHYLVSF